MERAYRGKPYLHLAFMQVSMPLPLEWVGLI